MRSCLGSSTLNRILSNTRPIKAPRATTDNLAMANTTTGSMVRIRVTALTTGTLPTTAAARAFMLRNLRRHPATPTNAHRCQALAITGWTDIGISLVDGTFGSEAIGCVRRMLAGIGLHRGTLAGVSSWASGVAAGGTSTADLPATTTGIKAVFRLPGRATGLPHKVDLDSVVATIAETGQETGNAEDAANFLSEWSPVRLRSHGRSFFGGHLLAVNRRLGTASQCPSPSLAFVAASQMRRPHGLATNRQLGLLSGRRYTSA